MFSFGFRFRKKNSPSSNSLPDPELMIPVFSGSRLSQIGDFGSAQRCAFREETSDFGRKFSSAQISVGLVSFETKKSRRPSG